MLGGGTTFLCTVMYMYIVQFPLVLVLYCKFHMYTTMLCKLYTETNVVERLCRYFLLYEVLFFSSSL